jgi:hypothetical protein
MKECIDEGTLQAWFDGELGREATAAVASHVASCPTCAQAARVVENESLLLSGALEPEFAESIPTERLRYRVEAAIAERQVARPVRSAASAEHGSLKSLRDLFFPSPQHAFGYAGLAAIIVLSTILGVIYLQRGKVNPIARNEPAKLSPGPSPEATSLGPGINKPAIPDRAVEVSKQRVPRKSASRDAATARRAQLYENHRYS